MRHPLIHGIKPSFSNRCLVMGTKSFQRALSIAALVAGVVWVNEVFAQEGGQILTQPPAPEQPGFMESLVGMLPMLAICYLIFWVMVIRPQESKVKKHKLLLDSLKRGDSVVTTGGIIGRVASVEKDAVMVEIAPNVKVKFSLSHILGLEKGDSKAEAA